jgi:putative inorganic carbon (HCO3(-)) transporter
MIRLIFVLILICLGAGISLKGPFYGLLFYLWNAYFRPESWLWSNSLRGIPLSFLIGGYIIISFIFSASKFYISGRVCVLFLFLLHTFFSTFFSLYYGYAWPFWVEFFKIIVMCYMILVLVDDFKKFRLVLLVIVSSLSFEGAKQGWMHLLTSPGYPNFNPLPFLGDNNGVAVGMLMLVPTIALLSQTTQRVYMRLFYWIVLIGVLYRGLSTYSRGGFIACALMALALWLHALKKLQILLVILPIALLIGISLPQPFWDRMQTITTYQEDEDASALGRLHYWEVAVAMAQSNPIFGVGFNAFNEAYNTYDFSHGQFGRNRSVHSSIFGVIAELGYVGVSFYILIISLAFRSCYKVMKLSKNRPELFELYTSAKSLQVSLIVFLAGGSFLAFQYFEMLWHYIALCFVLEKITMSKFNDFDKIG